MSAIPSLSEDEQTFGQRAENDAHDPNRSRARAEESSGAWFKPNDLL